MQYQLKMVTVISKRTFSRRGGWSKATTSFRSGLEDKVSEQILAVEKVNAYEQYVINYVIPESGHKYTPDFVLKNGVIIESKGIFEADDRKKHLLIKEQYPNLDIRFVFSNPNTKLYKGSPTTYGDWCDKHGFKYAKKEIPASWFKESHKDTTGLNCKERKVKGNRAKT